jgi:hypothetical protein
MIAKCDARRLGSRPSRRAIRLSTNRRQASRAALAVLDEGVHTSIRGVADPEASAHDGDRPQSLVQVSYVRVA